MNNKEYWSALDKLVADSEIVIDRPKGSKHPRFDYIYEIDYGYLKSTSSMDDDGIDVWLGSKEVKSVDAIICTIDLVKKDSEIKILVGCTDEEKDIIYNFHNDSESMKGILINR